MKKKPMISILRNQRGVSAIIVGVFILFVGIPIAALSVDVFHLIVVKNELQNAADAGALAGAAALYRETLGAAVDPDANIDAYDTATANKSENVIVELYNYNKAPNVQCTHCDKTGESISSLEYEDVQRGHWYFSNPSGLPSVVDTSHFECNELTDAVNISNYSTDQLNADLDSDGNKLNFINAVQVVTRRTIRDSGTPIISFFARIFGYENFQMYAKAVGYIGFAAQDAEVDFPIAICMDQILGWPSGTLTCNEGRMYNSNEDTARWTNMDVCGEPTNANLIKGLTSCDADSPILNVPSQGGLGTSEGQVESAFKVLYNCWLAASNEIVLNVGDSPFDIAKRLIDHNDPVDGIPDTPWAVTLPVMDCTQGPTCGPYQGLVEINVMWIADSVDPNNPATPKAMYYNPPIYDPNDIEYPSDGVDPDDDGIVWGPQWPNDTGNWDVLDPFNEPIYVTGPAYDPDDPDSEPQIWDIMKSFPDYDKIEKNILKDHPGWENPDPWPYEYPNWATQATVNDLFDFGAVRWASMVKHFNLKSNSFGFANYEQTTIYFMPTCKPAKSNGHSGFDNFGILAK
ncbi:hypothetical protein KA005_20580 [bacterium]|nr:hypothetical protein [bacterium]